MKYVSEPVAIEINETEANKLMDALYVLCDMVDCQRAIRNPAERNEEDRLREMVSELWNLCIRYKVRGLSGRKFPDEDDEE